MGHLTLWIDHQHAYLFEYNTDGLIEKKVKNHNDNNHDKDHLKKFYHETVDSIGNPDELLILGPGTAKSEFKHYCEEHAHHLFSKIVAVETMTDHPKKSEILEVSKKFFNHYFKWNNYV
jgi:stalled ribosome rescue protein Dom34